MLRDIKGKTHKGEVMKTDELVRKRQLRERHKEGSVGGGEGLRGEDRRAQ